MWPTVATGTATVAITGAQTVVTPFSFGRTLPFTPSMILFQCLTTTTGLRGATFQTSGGMTPSQAANLVVTYPAAPTQLGNLTVGWTAYA